jgi:hypothetical protein
MQSGLTNTHAGQLSFEYTVVVFKYSVIVFKYKVGPTSGYG